MFCCSVIIGCVFFFNIYVQFNVIVCHFEICRDAYGRITVPHLSIQNE